MLTETKVICKTLNKKVSLSDFYSIMKVFGRKNQALFSGLTDTFSNDFGLAFYLKEKKLPSLVVLVAKDYNGDYVGHLAFRKGVTLLDVGTMVGVFRLYCARLGIRVIYGVIPERHAGVVKFISSLPLDTEVFGGFVDGALVITVKPL